MSPIKVIKGILTHPLNRSGRISAIARFARWQIASRLMVGPIVLPFVNDTRLLVKSGMTGATGNWYCGLLEPAEMAFVLHALRPAELFADVGANVGVYSIMAAGAVGADVLAVEPIPSTFERLAANIRLNDLDRIKAHRVGISAKSGQLTFTTCHDCMNRVARPEDSGSKISVPVTTLDELCDRVPNIIKIDVEGHEMEVLRGASRLLTSEKIEAVIMETNGSGAALGVTDQDLKDLMAQYGFVACHYDWEQRVLTPTQSQSPNTIFIRDMVKISDKCKRAPQFRLVNRVI